MNKSIRDAVDKLTPKYQGRVPKYYRPAPEKYYYGRRTLNKMPRERECYRDNLQFIMEQFPGKAVLSVNEVAKWLGKSPETVKKLFPFRPGLGIAVTVLARELSPRSDGSY